MSNFHKIQDALQAFDWNSKESLAEKLLGADEYMMTWHCNSLCNYSCAYCGHYKNEHPFIHKFSNRQIADSFDRSGKTWHIIITGGEPFLRPGFVDLMVMLSGKHYISINTNLSQESVIDFAEKINPERVIVINAGIHINQRENRDGELEDYIRRYLFFQERKFNIIGSYVAYPPWMNRLEENIEFLQNRDLKQICAKSFFGEYKGKKYPEAYSTPELELITDLMHGQIDMPEYLRYTNFKGRKCGTGQNFLAMDPVGNLIRCLSVSKTYGNFFEGNYTFEKQAAPCPVDECKCPYQGMLYSSNIKQNRFMHLKNIFRK